MTETADAPDLFRRHLRSLVGRVVCFNGRGLDGTSGRLAELDDQWALVRDIDDEPALVRLAAVEEVRSGPILEEVYAVRLDGAPVRHEERMRSVRAGAHGSALSRIFGGESGFPRPSAPAIADPDAEMARLDALAADRDAA